MKNIFGTTEKLKLRDKNGVLRYEYNGDTQYTYDSMGNELKYEDYTGYWYKCTYDLMGNELTVENSKGHWNKSTYDSNGNELTFEDSYGIKRGFDIKQYTIQELEKKLGHSFIII